MKKEELRIGNYVMYDNKLVYIAEILKNGVRIYDGNGFDKITPYECIEPIVIDEHYLEKLGLECIELGYYGLFGENAEITYDVFMNIDGHLYCNGNHLNEFNYIHQVQNLYYLLNNKELKFQ